MNTIPIGGPITEYPDILSQCKTCTQARAYIAKDLTGEGIECGPGSDSNCYPLPLHTHVRYLDRFDSQTGCNQDYTGDFPVIDYKTTINKMEGISDSSLDFIVHCHVIEHSRNPLEALEMSWKKLKKSGTLIMAVPDKRRTFDRPRKLTSIRHIWQDYQKGILPERDLSHVHECKKIWIGNGHKMIWEMTDAEILNYLQKDMIDIHWHTYTSCSLKLLLARSHAKIPWKKTTVIPYKKFKNQTDFIEFYVICVK